MIKIQEHTLWQTEQELENLIHEVVSWDSRTGTEGEITFPTKLRTKLLELPYFKTHPDYIKMIDAGKGRQTVTALYNSGVTSKTVVLISHFDTVHIEEFGELSKYAFDTRKLTEEIKKYKQFFSSEVKEDIESEEFLFGRGAMDMKMGLCLHLHLLETASKEKWPINLLLLTVPDEEVNSSGMREGVKGLVQLKEQYQLEFTLFLNSEPTFSQHPNDNNYYIYSGSIGKIMPSALFFGKATHAGEPLHGLTGHLMASFLTQEMELNRSFEEIEFGEKTPLPICLQQTDLKEDYSTQTSHHVAALYNVFVFKQNAEQVMEKFKKISEQAMEKCYQRYVAACNNENISAFPNINVLEYKDLLEYAVKKLSIAKVNMIKEEVYRLEHLDERQKSIQICDRLMSLCQELAPSVIVFFAPPYYPPVNSSNDSWIQEKIALVKEELNQKFQIEATQVHYFNGISDLSYVNYDANDAGWVSFQKNTPVWSDVYHIPFKEMQQLNAPVLNVGPFGKDAHKLTERLHKKSAFIFTPYVLNKLIKSLF